MKSRCLALDNSRYCTGWAVVDIDTDNTSKEYHEGMKIVDYGFIDTHHIIEEGKTLIYIEQKFISIIKQYRPTDIAAEQMFHGKNSQTGIVLAGIHAIMKLVAAKNNIPITYYAIMTMKSATLGGIKTKKPDGTKKTGQEMKQEVMNEIFKIFGRETFVKEITDDVTDALSAAVTFVRHNGEGVGKQSADQKHKTTKKKIASKKTTGKTTKKESNKESKKESKKTVKKTTKKTSKKTSKTKKEEK